MLDGVEKIESSLIHKTDVSVQMYVPPFVRSQISLSAKIL
jgi:hypothetical protein